MAELTAQQRRALALAQARRRQRQQASVTHPEFDPANVPGGTGEPQFGMLGSFLHGAADTGSLGFGDEIASTIAAGLGMLPGGHGKPRAEILDEMRGRQSAAQEQNPGSFLSGQVGGGLAQGVATGGASFLPNATSLGGRMLGGALTGAAYGGVYGAGSGEDATSRAQEAGLGAGIGGVAGGAFPLVASGVSRGYQAVSDALRARPIARQAGTSPEALRMIGNVMDADGTRGPVGQANMARAGQDAMLADAGPNARAVLDTAVQRGGPGSVAARNQISQRTQRAAHALTDALDDALGSPRGVTASRTAIREGTAGARSSAYNRAYSQPIDYATQLGQEVENIVKSRVPGSAIRRANELMRAEGHQSRQILARIADDGSVTYERLPDVRQLDYITRALNDLASSGEGAGALGGQNALGRAYQNLSREIRDGVKELVPNYARALETAADPIRRSQAIETGAKLLSPSMTRDQAAEVVRGMTGPEKQALAQGVRSQIDDMMARVTRTVQDGDTTSREAIAALRNLSSRANREKMALVVGNDKARQLFSEIDRVATSFDMRASIADNSRTYARQATDRRIRELTDPGAIETAMQGRPMAGMQRVIQAMTGQTPERVTQRQDAVYSELARLLTQSGGSDLFNAVDRLGQTDQATQIMVDRILRAMSGPHLSYPATVQAREAIR